MGVKNFLLMVGVTLGCFLMLLDTSVIATVCSSSLAIKRQGDPSLTILSSHAANHQ